MQNIAVLLGEDRRQSVLAKASQSPFASFIFDAGLDINRIQRGILLIRYLFQNEVHESFISSVEISGTTADDETDVILDEFEKVRIACKLL